MSTPEVTPQAASTPALKIPERGTPEHLHWRKTGELTMPEPEKKEPEPSGGEQPEPAAASEAAKPQEPRKTRGRDQRIQQLLEEKRQLEQRLAEKDGRKPESPSEKPEAKKEPEKLTRPKMTDDDPATGKPYTWEAYEDALLEYATAKAHEKLRGETEKQRRESEIEAQNKAVVEEFKTQVDSARKKYKDFDEVALSNDVGKLIPNGSIIDLCILQTPLGAETLYYLGQHPEKISEILKMKPFQQSEALVKIQLDLQKPAAPAKPISKAPSPPVELGTRGAVPGNEAERAAKQGDFRSFREAQNAKDLAKRARG